jgi:hypothetical protein
MARESLVCRLACQPCVMTPLEQHSLQFEHSESPGSSSGPGGRPPPSATGKVGLTIRPSLRQLGGLRELPWVWLRAVGGTGGRGWIDAVGILPGLGDEIKKLFGNSCKLAAKRRYCLSEAGSLPGLFWTSSNHPVGRFVRSHGRYSLSLLSRTLGGLRCSHPGYGGLSAVNTGWDSL